MSFEVMSSRMPWPPGTVLSSGDLAGCNIGALVDGGHLRPAPQPFKKKAPAKPVETADEPEEQD